MATGWIQRGNLRGPTGPAGDAGTSITAAAVNGSGDLIITLSTGGEINAGHVVGAPGGGIDFETSVATVGDLPATAPYGEARYVLADGHLYVYEENGAGGGVDGWTDVGPIRGETGSTGPAGANGVSVTGAAIDGSGHLIITLSSGGPLDAGVARGPAGDAGPAGTNGAPGTQVLVYTTTPPAVGPLPVGSLAIGANGDLLEAV